MRSLVVTLLVTTAAARPDGPGGHHHHHAHGDHGDHGDHGHHAAHHGVHGVHGAHNTVSLGTHQVGGVINVQPAHHAVHHAGHHQQQPVHHAVHHQQEPVHHAVHHQHEPVHVVHAVHSVQPVQGHFRVEAGGDGSHHSQHSAPTSNSVAVTPVETKSSGQTVADLLSSNPKFSTLLTAVKAADLLGALGEPGPFTVFAPTNTAFDKVRLERGDYDNTDNNDYCSYQVPVETLNSLLNNKEELQGLLQRHVVSGLTMLGKNFPPGTTSLSTLGGEELSVTRDKFIQLKSSAASAYIVLFDVIASNGVIHAVDTVF